ncbi:MAG: amino acid permease [Gammaproteobacteria bacterium]
MSLFRTKSIRPPRTEAVSLRRCLSTLDLTLMGIGAIIGAGVFVLTGVAAATEAGPAITISYVISGLACLFSALAYAELAASIGGAGSAYTYSYMSFGELIAWIIGWDLILEYTMSVSTVAIGWSGYVKDVLLAMHINLPFSLIHNIFEGGIINLPAVLIIAFLTALLCVGVRQSSRFNAIIVSMKLVAIGVFIFVAIFHINVKNWHDFFPYGWKGVMNGAALVFFAYIGFDAVSTAAEETIDPQRSLPIGILTSVVICTIIYIIVAALLTGIVPYTELNVASPVSSALLKIGHRVAAGITALGAIAGLTTVMLVMYYGLTRICLAISRDGLLPPAVSHIHPRTHTPIKIIVSSGVIIAIIAGCFPIGKIAELVNIGTLMAFTLVCAGVITLRWTKPELHRPFKLPFNPIIPSLGILFCIYLMIHLPMLTWISFIIWMVIGLIFYFAYSKQHSVLAKEPEQK